MDCGAEMMNLMKRRALEELWPWVGLLGDKYVLFSEPSALCLGDIPLEALSSASLRSKWLRDLQFFPRFLLGNELLSRSWPVLNSDSLAGGNSHCCGLLCNVHVCDQCLGCLEQRTAAVCHFVWANLFPSDRGAGCS